MGYVRLDAAVSRTKISFFFRAEDGVRDVGVTGVQTCALPISGRHIDLVGTMIVPTKSIWRPGFKLMRPCACAVNIGRASCRERALPQEEVLRTQHRRSYEIVSVRISTGD